MSHSHRLASCRMVSLGAQPGLGASGSQDGKGSSGVGGSGGVDKEEEDSDIVVDSPCPAAAAAPAFKGEPWCGCLGPRVPPGRSFMRRPPPPPPPPRCNGAGRVPNAPLVWRYSESVQRRHGLMYAAGSMMVLFVVVVVFVAAVASDSDMARDFWGFLSDESIGRACSCLFLLSLSLSSSSESSESEEKGEHIVSSSSAASCNRFCRATSRTCSTWFRRSRLSSSAVSSATAADVWGLRGISLGETNLGPGFQSMGLKPVESCGSPGSQ